MPRLTGMIAFGTIRAAHSGLSPDAARLCRFSPGLRPAGRKKPARRSRQANRKTRHAWACGWGGNDPSASCARVPVFRGNRLREEVLWPGEETMVW